MSGTEVYYFFLVCKHTLNYQKLMHNGDDPPLSIIEGRPRQTNVGCNMVLILVTLWRGQFYWEVTNKMGICGCRPIFPQPSLDVGFSRCLIQKTSFCFSWKPLYCSRLSQLVDRPFLVTLLIKLQSAAYDVLVRSRCCHLLNLISTVNCSFINSSGTILKK